MAITVTYADFGNWFSTAAQSVTVSYDAGDILVVASGGENGGGSGAPVVAPTAANVTFEAVGGSPSNISEAESACGMWVGEATGSGSSVTIKGATAGQGSGAVWKVQGGTLTDKIELGPNTTEAVFNQAVAAGDAVFYAGFDWNAHTGDLTRTTGSGTGNERADFGNGTSWGGWLCDWVGTAAGTFDFGVTDYSALKINHAALVLKAAAVTTTLEQEGFRFYADDGDEDASTALAAQDTDATATLGTLVHYRALLNATGDPASLGFTLRAQQNGAGGYVEVPVGASSDVAPVIETGDVTPSGNNTAQASWAMSTPAAVTGDLLIAHLGWDDSTTTSSVSLAAGPNGETWTQIGTYVASANTEVRAGVFYTVATGTWSTGTITVTPSATESWLARVVKVPAGEFDGATPIGAADEVASAGTAETGVDAPALTAGSLDGGGRLINWSVADVDPQTLTGTGWSQLSNQDIGGLSALLASRDAATTDSESIAQTEIATIASDSWCSVGFIIRGVTVTNELYVATSANIGGADATTARLTAPAGKTTADFVAGVISDNANPLASVNITTDDYAEVGHVLATQAPAVATDFWDLRYYAGAVALDTYTTTGRLTIGSGGGTVEGTGTLVYGYTVAATGTPTRLGTGALTYGGAGTGTGTRVSLGTSVATYGYAVAGTGIIQGETITGTATLAYGGTVAAIATRSSLGAGVLVYGGATTATGTAQRLGTAALSYGYALAGTGAVQGTVTGTAALAYGGTLAGSGLRTSLGTTVLVYGGTVAATGGAVELGTGALTYGGTLAATGLVARLGTAVAAYGYTVAGAGVIPTGAVLGTAALAYGGTLTASSLVARHGSGVLVYGGTLTGSGVIPTDSVLGTATLAYGGTLAATGTRSSLGTVVLAYGGQVAAVGVPAELGAVALAYGGTLTGTGLVVHLGTVVLAYGGTVVYVEPGAGWGWSLRRSGTPHSATARVSRGGTLHPTTTTVT